MNFLTLNGPVIAQSLLNGNFANSNSNRFITALIEITFTLLVQ